jgi:hypothetical protein
MQRQDAPAQLPTAQANAPEGAVARQDAAASLPTIRATDDDTCTCPNCEAAAEAAALASQNQPVSNSPTMLEHLENSAPRIDWTAVMARGTQV